jgi:hypothetical protein
MLLTLFVGNSTGNIAYAMPSDILRRYGSSYMYLVDVATATFFPMDDVVTIAK